MTKQEAIQAMSEGKKVTHRFFSSEEWITMENGTVLCEDNHRHFPQVFWAHRENKGFEKDWSIWKDSSPVSEGMKELVIYKFQADHIEDTFRKVINLLGSIPRETCLDRDIMEADGMIKNVLKGEPKQVVPRYRRS